MNPTSDGVKTLAMLGFGAADVARSFGIHVEARLLQMLSREGKVLIEINKAVGFRLVTKAGTTGAMNLIKFVPIVVGFGWWWVKCLLDKANWVRFQEHLEKWPVRDKWRSPPRANVQSCDIADFKVEILTFLREEVPSKWHTYCDQVTDNFRIISPEKFRVLH